MRKDAYPFTAIVGQQLMKKAVLLGIINPRLSTILLRGFRGTAKTTMVNSLGNIVPDIEIAAGCHYNCSPADKGNLCPDCRSKLALGTMESVVQPMPIVHLSDHPYLLSKRYRRIESWADDYRILAGANRGLLVAEKINLYDPRIAESLVNFGTKGFKYSGAPAPSNFVLIATMNIEDGEISPDLMERFALQINVTDITDIEERIEITKRGIDYRKNPQTFCQRFHSEEDKMKKRLVKAREDLSKVETPAKMLEAIAATTKKYKIKGLEQTLEQTARTNAAYEGKRYISIDDLKEVLEITVAHKL